MKEFAERLKHLRRAFGLSQSELAEKVELGQTTISDYEGNRREPTARALLKLARFFGVSVDYLLGITDNPQPWENDLPETIKEKLKDCDKLREDFDKFLNDLQKLIESRKNKGL